MEIGELPVPIVLMKEDTMLLGIIGCGMKKSHYIYQQQVGAPGGAREIKTVGRIAKGHQHVVRKQRNKSLTTFSSPLDDTGASPALPSPAASELITSSRTTRGGDNRLSLVVDEAGEGGLHSSTLLRRLSSDSTAVEVRVSSVDSCREAIEKTQIKISRDRTPTNR